MLRPERESPAWELRQQAEKSFPHLFAKIDLQPLNRNESSALVDRLLQISDLTQTLRNRIQDKAPGNPFFVEEVVRTLIESGMVEQDATGRHWRKMGMEEDIDLPGNLQTLLIARIDRCLLYTSPSPRDATLSRMPSSA